MSDFTELQMLAEKATPGPWWIDSHGHRMVSQADGVQPIFQAVDLVQPAVRHPETGNLSHWPNDWDASFIATANPKTVLELLASLAAERARVAELEEELDAAAEWDVAQRRVIQGLHDERNQLAALLREIGDWVTDLPIPTKGATAKLLKITESLAAIENKP